MKLVSVSLLGAAAALAASGAMAADPLPPTISPVVAAAPPPPGCTVAGYVDAFGGIGWGNEWQYDLPEYEEVWRALGFGGAGRAAIQCKPRFSIQLDAWAEHWEGVQQEIDYGDPIGPPEYFTDTVMGIGTHLTFHAGNFATGALLSVGAVADWGTFATAALEAAFNSPKFRVQGQAGATIALLGDAAALDARDYYAQVVAAFYPKPNVSFSATFGGDVYSDTDPWFWWAVNWGGRIEFQPMERHFSLYIAYQGWYWREGPGVDPDYYAGIEHVVGIGIRFLAGAQNLRAMDEQVGLADYNAIYGLTFPR